MNQYFGVVAVTTVPFNEASDGKGEDGEHQFTTLLFLIIPAPEKLQGY